MHINFNKMIYCIILEELREKEKVLPFTNSYQNLWMNKITW